MTSLLWNPWTILGIVVMLGVSHLMAYNKGHTAASRSAVIEELKATIRAAQADRDAQAEAAEKATEDARRNQGLAELAEKEARSYADELSKRPEGGRCTLDDADADRLRRAVEGTR